ncbi:response regulator [Achromobacter kerstersii]|uniref:Protein-glutamate methylesterase/protein-glutamine glutaminase n=1 Tax=Achromobacter kerstersii TaxID=1353890 RepID=A0A6S7A4N7_9BURK|nr:response regulator [Achromobacter kerstersii]CAB3711263.1 Protein-glutamate methylesterase/protein-glutamine glutaminase [Achromobacter kerstersii]
MRVLIVDDDSDTAELTAECLMVDGDVTVQIAHNGAAALREVAEFSPDAILLDVELSDASGLDLASDLKTLRGLARIIVFSGTVPRSDSGYLPPGVDAWLAKPAHLEQFKPVFQESPIPSKGASKAKVRPASYWPDQL